MQAQQLDELEQVAARRRIERDGLKEFRQAVEERWRTASTTASQTTETMGAIEEI